MWTHVVLSAIAFFAYLSSVNFVNFRGGTTTLLIVGLPAVLPFLVSARWCWQLYTWQLNGPGALRALAFVAVLVAGSALVDAAVVGAFGVLQGFNAFLVLLFQAFAYVWAANWILDVI